MTLVAEPRILLPDYGHFNGADWSTLAKSRAYRDLSTVILTPAIAAIPPRVVQSWMALLKPMNQRCTHMMVEHMEVGQAYSAAIEQILANPLLSTWRYVLTLETDNAPPPDGLLKLLDDIESGPWSAVGGLYWTKGEGGQPMCYGRPDQMPRDFAPFLPPPDAVTECNGLGMGFTLFKLDLFRDERLPRPWFRTVQEYTPGVGAAAFTQDLWFFNEAAKAGHRFACSTRALVGHFDQGADRMW